MGTQYEIGRLSYFRNEGGYGFVSRGEDKGDVFIHLSKLVKCDPYSMLPRFIADEMGTKDRERYLFTGGDIILIEIGESDKGSFAIRWSVPHLIKHDVQVFVVFCTKYIEDVEDPVPYRVGSARGWLTTKTISSVLTPMFVCGSEREMQEFVDSSRGKKNFVVKKYRVINGVTKEVG